MKKQIIALLLIVVIFLVACTDATQEKENISQESKTATSSLPEESGKLVSTKEEGTYKGNTWSMYIYENPNHQPENKEGTFLIDGERLSYEKEVIGESTAEHYTDESYDKTETLSYEPGFYRIYKSTDDKTYELWVDLKLDEDTIEELATYVFRQYAS